MIDRGDVERAVADLDDTAKSLGVAAAVLTLRRAGAKGRRNSVRACVVADYVRRKTDPTVLLEVDVIETVLIDPGPGRVRIGQNLADLIRRFDAGEFPELELPAKGKPAEGGS